MKTLQAHLNRASGWRARQELSQWLETARTDFGAALGCFDNEEWDEMLLNIRDGFKSVTRLRKALREAKERAIRQPCKT